MSKKPNVIFILADQLRYQSCGYNGDKLAKTPHMDSLAKSGVSMDNAVSNMPVCSAFRASLFTGKYVTSTGMVINELRLNPNHETLANVLSKGGYKTGYIGKWHMWANKLGGHDQVENSFIPSGEYRLGFDDYFAGYNFRHEYSVGKAYYHEDSHVKQYYTKYEPDQQTDMAIDYIKKQKDKPFALFLSYGTPHDPWEKDNVKEEDYKVFENVQFPIAPNYADELDKHGDNWSNIDKSIEKINEWKKVYYAMVHNMDTNIGRIMDVIHEKEMERETIVVFTSDHGEMFGAHGRMKKNIFYEESVRIPFLVSWKGQIEEGAVQDMPFSCVDIMPTLLGLLGLSIPEEVEGSDLSHSLISHEGINNEYALLQNTGACAIWEDGYEWRGIRDRRYTYAIYKTDGEEHLYDNLKDPYQLLNLVGQKNHNNILTKMRQRLKIKMTKIGDSFEKSTWYREEWTENRCIKDKLNKKEDETQSEKQE